MKKLAFFSLSLAVCMYMSIFASHTQLQGDTDQTLTVINVDALTEQDLMGIIQGDNPEIAIEFTAHNRLSVGFFLNGDLFNLVENEEQSGTIEIKHSFYVRCVEQELFFSFDLENWKPFLEYVTGKASLNLSVQDGHPSITLGAEVNRRL